MTAPRVALLAAALLAASPSAAEPPAAPAEPAGTQVGVGVGLDTAGTIPVLYLPIQTRGARIELDGAYRKTGTSDASTTEARVGLGVFGRWGAAQPIRGSAGVRAEYLRDAASIGNANAALEAIRTAAVLGGEWAPVPAFSIGVEGQVGYTAGLSDAASGLDVSAQAIVRVFLATAKPSGGAAAASATKEPPGPRRPKKCEQTSDCEGREICYEGYCRR